MIVVLRQMIFSVTSAAIFGSVMLTLVRKSALKEVVRLATGMLMILALLQPLRAIQLPSASAWLHSLAIAHQTQKAENNSVSRSVFEQAVAQTIVQQAGEQGISCSAQVTMDGDGEKIQIRKIRITGQNLQVQMQETLNQIITDCCGEDVSIEFAEESQ